MEQLIQQHPNIIAALIGGALGGLIGWLIRKLGEMDSPL